MTAETSNAQQQGLTEAWQDEWRSAVAAKLSSYGLSEEAAAVFAESELGEYRAGLCDCAENEPADMVDLMMGVALDAIEKWKAESEGRPFGYKRTAPPSAPVGVGDVVMAARNAENAIRNCAAAGQIGEGYVQYADDLRDAVQRLAQQPAPSAPVGLSSEDRVVLMRLKDALPDVGLNGWIYGVRVIERILAQQPAAVDEAYPAPRNRAEAVALARLALAHLGVIDAHIDAAIARCETNSAAQHQEPTT